MKKTEETKEEQTPFINEQQKQALNIVFQSLEIYHDKKTLSMRDTSTLYQAIQLLIPLAK